MTISFHVEKIDRKRVGMLFLLAFSIFLPVHLLWFVQTPIWYPFRCLLNGLPITLLLFIPAFLCARVTRLWSTLITLLLLVPSVFAGMHLFYYQSTISQQSLFAIFESNFSESTEFLLSQISALSIAYFLVLLGLPAALLVRIWRMPQRDSLFSRIVAGILILAAVILCFTGKIHRLAKDHLGCQLLTSVQEYKKSIADLEAYLATASQLTAPGIMSEDEPRTLVVLIGESSSRHHWGLYGYFRDTTPKLSAMREDLLVFKDVISPFGRTTLSVASALTCKDVPQVGDIPLVNIYRQAGFETVWISNQSTVDDTNMVVRLVSGADRKIYLNKGGDQSYICSYDEKIVHALKDIFSEAEQPKKRVIFVHMMGSHVNYASRVPEGFERFTKKDPIEEKPWFTRKSKKYINDYDNSIVYTDHVISEVIELVRNLPGGAVFFFSDHGEEVYDTHRQHGHHNSLDTRYNVDIPCLIWLSDSYKKSMEEDWFELWKRAQSIPFVNSAAPYIMLDISGVSFETERMADSPLSPQFDRSKKRIVLGLDYDEYYSGDNGLREQIKVPLPR